MDLVLQLHRFEDHQPGQITHSGGTGIAVKVPILAAVFCCLGLDLLHDC